VVDAPTVQCIKSCKAGELIDHARGQEQLSTGDLAPVGTDDPESIRRTGGVQYLDLAELNGGVTGDLLAGEVEKLCRPDAIAGEVTVETL
jgi:hypothetical protein